MAKKKSIRVDFVKSCIIDGRRKPRPTLVVRRSGGNWTRAWEYETPPASGTRERSSRYHFIINNFSSVFNDKYCMIC